MLSAGSIVSGFGCLALFWMPEGSSSLAQIEWRTALFGAGVGLMSSSMSNAAVSSVSGEFLTGVRTAMFFCAVLLLVCGAVVILFRLRPHQSALESVAAERG
ncbi:hypothetical protein K7711_12325 [Nocardia sp. CA2R105]|uniref:hypothetical protein n=1 Tax=Nocardia coffeae TaxID=2873381 RepID=UPI001CA7A4DE|nr:hypothetical protein [Nocardia coffeae]MBY8857267.1 hypothetical protein [Nocardia coffeae]